MAYTVMNTEGIGAGLSNLAKLFSQGPGLAVEADMNRQKRNALVAQTALDQQAYSRKAASDKRSQELIGQLTQPGIAEILATPEGRAMLGTGFIQFGDTGPVAGDPQNTLGLGTLIAPDMLDDGDLSNAGFGAGTSWQNTPTGVAQGLENDLKKQVLANQGDLQKTILGDLLGTASGGNKGFAPMDVSGEDAVALEQSVDAYLASTFAGKALDPGVRSALLAEAGREAATSHSLLGAVDRAAARLDLLERPDPDQPGRGQFGRPIFEDDRTQLYLNPEAAPAANPTTAVGNQVVQQLLQSMGLDLGGIGQPPAASPSGAPGAPALAVGAPIPEAALPMSLRDPNIPDGEIRQSATPGAPKLQKTNGKWVRIE